MWILAVSDSHGHNELVRKAIKQVREDYGPVDVLFHMGDIEVNVEELKEMGVPQVFAVKGNCDYRLDLPEMHVAELGGHVFLLTHGHMQRVHTDLFNLELLARMNDADVVLFGHTHYPLLDVGDDLTFINPGSICLPRQDGNERTFMVIEIKEDGEISYHPEKLR